MGHFQYPFLNPGQRSMLRMTVLIWKREFLTQAPIHLGAIRQS
jgi:hypothetical protein